MVRRLFLVVCVMLTAKTAASEDARKVEADRLVAEGSRLGKKGDLRGAIEKFKEAESLWPSPVNDCNVGLGFRRLNDLPRAHMYLSRCRARWIRDESLPGWLDAEIGKVREELSKGQYAAVSLTTVPGNAEIAISAFGGDELRSPTTVWLPFGAHTIVARKTGYRVSERVVNVESRTASSLRIELLGVREDDFEDSGGSGSSSPGSGGQLSDQLPGRDGGTNWKKVGWYVGGGGVGLLAVALGYNFLVERPANSDAEAVGQWDPPGDVGGDETQEWKDWRSKRNTSIVLYVVSGAVMVSGAALILLGPDGNERGPVALSGFVDQHGGYASLGWSF